MIIHLQKELLLRNNFIIICPTNFLKMLVSRKETDVVGTLLGNKSNAGQQRSLQEKAGGLSDLSV